MKISIQNSISNLNAQFIGDNSDYTIDSISIDSRSLQNSSTSLFFALVGPNNDAHHYIEDLIRQGVCYFVVNNIPDNCVGKANFLVVKDTLIALQQLAISLSLIHI